VIESAAAEPELAELAAFLNACGAKIRGAGTHCVEIEGVASLGGTEWTMPPDRIEVGTLLLAGAATRGDVEVEGCRPDEIAVLLDLFQRAGVPFEERRDPSGGGSVRVLPWERPPRVLDVSTRPYPGFPTDLQAQWMAFCTIGEGLAVITDRVYPDRFMHVPELNRLGASVRREGPTALVVGPAALSGAPITASDLRASAGLVIAGLVAEGMTTVRRVYHLDRGYEALETKLRALGGDVRRVVDEAGP
ncbi:MAG TPA: UDP-N-acetylglucosamine 1-carboxyvinyltransferase, partial [Planctomycetota bacterium]